MENLIEIQDVVKRFGEQTVLDHVSLSVTPGKIYGIIGRNGSGKTVLLKHLWFCPAGCGENPGSWQTGGEGCGYPTGNWNYY